MMIGHAYPVEDTGWSVLEVGELDRATFTLVVQGYQVSNRAGESIGELYATLDAALSAAPSLALFALKQAAEGSACSENRQSTT
ncbi:MAG: hypothetical protein ABIM24_06355 [Paraperlucidibaca sp.]